MIDSWVTVYCGTGHKVTKNWDNLINTYIVTFSG